MMSLCTGGSNLCINVEKTKEMVVDFRRRVHIPPPLFIGGEAVELVTTVKYLGLQISNNLKWTINTASIIKKSHQRLYFIRRLKQAGLSAAVLTSVNRCEVASVLTSSITVWYG